MIVLWSGSVILPSGRIFRPQHRQRKKGGYTARRRYREQSAGPGWTKEEFTAHCERFGNLCLCCRETGVKLVPDHIVPLIRGGEHHLSNIQPLCLKCNFRKGLQIIDYR